MFIILVIFYRYLLLLFINGRYFLSFPFPLVFEVR